MILQGDSQHNLQHDLQPALRPGTPHGCAVFIDRDGVVNRRRVADYVKTWQEFQFLPDIFQVLPEIHAAGYRAILITNQQGIAKGLMAEGDLAAIHAHMQDELYRRTGHRFDGIYFCPHGKDDGCNCRKPEPGMLLRAADEHGIQLSCSWMIGDSESDVVAGLRAGCRAIRIGERGTETAAERLVENLAGAWGEVGKIAGLST